MADLTPTFAAEYTLENCRPCRGTGKSPWIDALSPLCIFCDGDGEVRVYRDQGDDEEP